MTLQHYRTCPTSAQLTLHDSFARLVRLLSTHMSVTQLVTRWRPDSYKTHLAVTGLVKSAPDSSSCSTTKHTLTRLIKLFHDLSQTVARLINLLQDSSTRSKTHQTLAHQTELLERCLMLLERFLLLDRVFGTICLKHPTTLILPHLLRLPSKCTCSINVSKLSFS